MVDVLTHDRTGGQMGGRTGPLRASTVPYRSTDTDADTVTER